MGEINQPRPARKSAPALTIIHTITQDNFDGSPWPPDGSDLWCVVSRVNGHTTWRHIIPQQTSDDLARIRADVDQQVRTLVKAFAQLNTGCRTNER
jgi:hypothetical protein